jgi:hypothetical protein
MQATHAEEYQFGFTNSERRSDLSDSPFRDWPSHSVLDHLNGRELGWPIGFCNTVGHCNDRAAQPESDGFRDSNQPCVRREDAVLDGHMR